MNVNILCTKFYFAIPEVEHLTFESVEADGLAKWKDHDHW